MSQNRLLKGIDWTVLILGLLIVTFGIMNVYSVNPDLGVKQLIWFGLGMVMILGLIIASGNNRNFFEIYSPVFYIVSLVLLVGVLIVGKEINGAKAWYRFAVKAASSTRKSSRPAAEWYTAYLHPADLKFFAQQHHWW